MKLEAIWVVGAALAHFVLGWVWYTVFSKQWLKAWNLRKGDINPRDPKPFLLAFIGSLWTAYGLFLICKHIEPQSLSEELGIAIGCWLFIHVGLGAKHYAFARVKGSAFAIDYGLDLVGVVIMTLMVY